MMIAKNDEAKRSRIWRIVTAVTSILIVAIAAFFLFKLFMSNPIEGIWENEDSSIIINVKSNNSIIVDMPELSEGTGVRLMLDYVLDKEEKNITVKENESSISKAAKASGGKVTEQELKNAVNPLVTTFDYSVDGERLTLTEREYGEQTVFTKK